MCDHFDPLPAGEAARLGLPVLRAWGVCAHESLPRGDYVCPCACGNTCPGFLPILPG